MSVQDWIRAWRVRAGPIDVTNLDLEFQVRRTLKPEPNTARLTVYGLSTSSQQTLSNAGEVDVSIEAGYQGRLAQIFLGQMRGGITTIEQPELITTMEIGDAEKKLRSARGSVTIPGGANASLAIQQLAKALGVKPGNTQLAAARLQARGVALWPVSTVIAGSVRKSLSEVADAAGLEWSVQDGALQWLDKGAANMGTAVALREDTGLIGSPKVDQKGVVNATALITPGLLPGNLVLFGAKFVVGLYRIDEVEFTGSTYAQEWYAELVCTPAAKPAPKKGAK